MPEARWGPVSNFLVSAFRSGIGADRFAAIIRGTEISMPRADVRAAFDILRGEGVLQDAIGRLRGNVAVPEFYVSNGGPRQVDAYRYNITMTTEQVVRLPDGTETTVTSVSYRSLGSDTRLSKDEAVAEFLSRHEEALEDYEIQVTNATVSNVYRRR